MTPLTERFWSKVNKRGPRHPVLRSRCWLWTDKPTRYGYGQLSRGGRGGGMVKAHRLSFEMANGDVYPGNVVMHLCDVRMCVRPSHLKQGTHAENVADMHAKGRAAMGAAVSNAGESNGMSKLTSALVANIRRLYASGETQVNLAKKFGVCQAVISKIVRNESWTKEQYLLRKEAA